MKSMENFYSVDNKAKQIYIIKFNAYLDDLSKTKLVVGHDTEVNISPCFHILMLTYYELIFKNLSTKPQIL